MNIETGEMVTLQELRRLEKLPGFDRRAWVEVQAVDRQAAEELARRVKLGAAQIGSRKIRRRQQRSR